MESNQYGLLYMINIDIKYFGMVAETVQLESEIFEISKDLSVRELKLILVKKYPGLGIINYNVAMNLDLADDNEKISENCEIAILPPYAGG